MKHTPGPWHVDTNYLDDVLDSKGADVATTFTPKGTGQKHSDERRANARLIAASPELLSVLKDVIQDDADLAGLAVERAHKIIAKAEGK